MISSKSILGAVVASALLASSAFAADTALLAPGKAAGTKQADLSGPSPLIWVGLAVVAVGIAFAVSDNGDNNKGTSTTTATGTSS